MRKHAIGIDLGGTSIKYALIGEDGTFASEGILPSKADESADKIIEQLFKAINLLQEEAKKMAVKIEGIGIGTPGIVDEREGIVLGGAENLVGWENIPLADIIREKINLPVYVNNDANVMGFAEAVFGAAKGCSDVLFFTIGTGIGGAAIIDGKLYGGYKNRGGEFGHVPLIANGEICACGAVGCFEHYASATGMIRRYKERLGNIDESMEKVISGKEIVDLYHRGDEVAAVSVNENCEFIGQGIAGFINVFAPQKVIIGGGLADAGEFYLDKIRKVVKKYVMADCAVNTQIENAKLGNRAGCLGAAGLVFKQK